MPATGESLRGRVAAITGASSGIGAAAARRLAREGVKVALGARRKGKLDGLVKEVEDGGGEALAVEVDVRDWESVKAFADATRERFGGCDVLFANAGVGGGGPVSELDVETWNRLIDTNLTGVFHACKAFLPLMEGREGWRTIAVTASVAGTMGIPGGSAYAASKWGVRGFVQSLAEEVAGEGIRATTINPGYVNTEWHEDHPRGGEMIQPEDLADLLVYLAAMPGTSLIDDVTVWPARMYSG